MKKVIDKFRGCLLGLAVGDAVGTAVEFKAPGTFKPITEMTGGGLFNLEPGYWTDDTSLAMCLAESLLLRQGFDPVDQLKRYSRWRREGYWSSNGSCFDIGITTSRALARFEKTGEIEAQADDNSAGNGSIMRLAPIPMFYSDKPLDAINRAADSSKTTHSHRVAVDACRYLSALLVGLLNCKSKEKVLRPEYFTNLAHFDLCDEIKEISQGSYREKSPPDINGSGYVVRTLEAALWAFYNSEDFETGCLKVVNLGDDADTTGAVFGQLAGACYGESGIPARWLNCLKYGSTIRTISESFFFYPDIHNSSGIITEGAPVTNPTFQCSKCGREDGSCHCYTIHPR